MALKVKGEKVVINGHKFDLNLFITKENGTLLHVFLNKLSTFDPELSAFLNRCSLKNVTNPEFLDKENELFPEYVSFIRSKILPAMNKKTDAYAKSNILSIMIKNKIFHSVVGFSVSSTRKYIFSQILDEGDKDNFYKFYRLNFKNGVGECIRNYRDKSRKAKVKEAIKDNTTNIIPYIILKNKTAKDLKVYFGKNLWKRVCKLSFTKNQKIAKTLALVFDHGNLGAKASAHEKKITEILSGTRYRLIDDFYYNFGNNNDFDLSYVEILFNLADEESPIGFLMNIVDDTLRIDQVLRLSGFARDNNLQRRDIKKIKTANSLNKYHDYLSVAYSNFAKTTNRNYEFIALQSLPKEIKYKENTTINVLQSTKELVREGVLMNNCVSSYNEKIVMNEYIILVLKRKGKRSNLGLTYNKKMKRFVFHQHYFKNNELVNDPVLGDKEFIGSVISLINKSLEKNTLKEAS